MIYERLYGRFGPRYPRLVLAIALRLEYVMVILGSASLALFVEMSLAQAALLAVAAVAGQEFYALLTIRNFRPRLEPVAGWIEAARTEEAAIDAWRAAGSAPYERI